MNAHIAPRPRLGAIQVNATDYDGKIVVERFGFYNGDEPMWAVPAWEECGQSGLRGPFATVADAERAIRAYRSDR